MRPAALVLLLATASVAWAQDEDASEEEADEEAAREEALFGTPAPVEPLEADTTAAPDGPFLDELEFERTTETDIYERLARAEERLAIGGWAWLRLDGRLDEEDELDTLVLASPNLLDLFVDARPNDRVRAYARARLQHDLTVDEGDVDFLGQPVDASIVRLDQLWLKFDVARDVYVTAGRQRIKWGAGRFWNPTDFMNQQVLDPLAIFDVRTGVGLVKVHVPFEAAGLNVYALGNVEGASELGDVGGAGRVEWLVGITELSASIAARRGTPLRIGGDVSSGLGPLDVRLEAAVQHGVQAPFWEGELDLEGMVLPTEVDRSDEWIPQVVGGAELGVRYSDEDAVYFGVEGFWNDAGYEDADLYPWLIYQGQFQPFYLGRLYAAGYAHLPAPGRWQDSSFTLSTIANVSDRSAVTRLDARTVALTHLGLNAYVAGHWGQTGELRLGIEVPPSPALPDGLVVPRPVVDLGLGATLDF